MEQRIVQNESTAAKRRVYFTAVKVDDVTDDLVTAELGTWVVKIMKHGVAGADAPSGSTVTEVDPTDAPGLWYWEGNAADFDTLGPLIVRITNSSGSKVMRSRTILVHVVASDSIYGTPPVDVTKWNGTAVATPTTAGVPRVDVKAMETGVLTNTAIASDAISAAKVADGTLDLATFAADALLSAFGIANMGTAQSGSTSTTIKLASAASSSDDRYINGVVLITGGTGAGQINQISDYTGATRVADVAQTWATTPDATSTYVVYAGGAASAAPSAATVATEVWAKVLEGSFTAADMQRLFAAALIAKASGWDTGTLVFRDLGDTKNRFVSTVDEDDGRTSLSILDAT